MGLEQLMAPQGKEVIPAEGGASEGSQDPNWSSQQPKLGQFEQQNNNFTL